MVYEAPGLLPAWQVAWLAGYHEHHFITMCQEVSELCALGTTTMLDGRLPFVPCRQ